METIEGTTGAGKDDIFARFAAELQAAGIDPALVFAVVDEVHGGADADLLARMRKLAVAGRDARIDLHLDRRDYLQDARLGDIGDTLDPALREQLAAGTITVARPA